MAVSSRDGDERPFLKVLPESAFILSPAHLTLCGGVRDSRIDSSPAERMQGKNEASISGGVGLDLGSRGV